MTLNKKTSFECIHEGFDILSQTRCQAKICNSWQLNWYILWPEKSVLSLWKLLTFYPNKQIWPSKLIKLKLSNHDNTQFVWLKLVVWFYWMNQDWVQELILAWFWHHFHLVLDGDWSHDPPIVRRVLYFLTTAFDQKIIFFN